MKHQVLHTNLFILLFVSLITTALTSSCKKNAKDDNAASGDSLVMEIEENREAKEKMQGIWIDAETENVVFRVKSDSIFYPDSLNLPVYFRIMGDSLELDGDEIHRYKIIKQGDFVFEFVTSSGESVKLHKSDNPEDSLAFAVVHTKPVIYTDVTKRDSVVVYDNTRYHCYVFVNPSHNKVYRTSYNDEGMKVENFYYDNIINLSVFQGNKRLFSRDFNKKDFKDIVPEPFLQQATLSDVNFSHVDEEGFHFDATICIPDDAMCYMIQVLVDREGKYELNLMDY